MSIKVLLADDHGIIRQGLRSLLEKEPDIQVVGICLAQGIDVPRDSHSGSLAKTERHYRIARILVDDLAYRIVEVGGYKRISSCMGCEGIYNNQGCISHAGDGPG